VPGDKDHPAYDMYSSNRLLVDGYPGMLGGKTGYTDDARKTFVGVAERDGHRILVVQMYGLSVEGDMYCDQAREMFEYGFRAGPEVTVGRLVDSTREAAESTAPRAASSPDSHLASSGSDTASPMSVRVLIGLVAALAAVVLLLLGLRLFGRR
jgi:D-alanyl-D-alanine carboxypeptidase (penicillin-binding protein 5/6)